MEVNKMRLHLAEDWDEEEYQDEDYDYD